MTKLRESADQDSAAAHAKSEKIKTEADIIRQERDELIFMKGAKAEMELRLHKVSDELRVSYEEMAALRTGYEKKIEDLTTAAKLQMEEEKRNEENNDNRILELSKQLNTSEGKLTATTEALKMATSDGLSMSDEIEEMKQRVFELESALNTMTESRDRLDQELKDEKSRTDSEITNLKVCSQLSRIESASNGFIVENLFIYIFLTPPPPCRTSLWKHSHQVPKSWKLNWNRRDLQLTKLLPPRLKS